MTVLPADHWIARRTPMQVRSRMLDARDYNSVRIGLLRLGTPLRLGVREIRGLDCIIDTHAWVAVDGYCDDQPLFALTDFRRGRSALDEAVSCKLRIFHHRAGLIIGHTLDGLRHAVALRLGHHDAFECPGPTD
jgi:hypothetical protein